MIEKLRMRSAGISIGGADYGGVGVWDYHGDMIRVRQPGRFKRFGQLVEFLLLWGGMNIILANWLISDSLNAPRPIVLATIAINFVIALFSEVLVFQRPGRPMPAPTLAGGTTTNRSSSAVRYHSSIAPASEPFETTYESSTGAN